MNNYCLDRRHGRVIITIPFPCLLSVVRLRVCRVPGDRIEAAPGVPAFSVKLPPFLFRELFIGSKFFHRDTSLENRLIDLDKEPVT